MGEKENAYIDLSSKSEGAGPRGRLRRGLKDNTKINVK
jgi:hypothetical protein